MESCSPMNQPLIPEEYLDELDGVCHFERAFQNRYQNLSQWPTWFKSTLKQAIQQSHGPFAIFLNHDKSIFTTTFSRQILCSPSILNLLQKYKCILWPWDITYLANKRRLIERSGIARKILLECLAHFNDADNYPLLLLLIHQNSKVVLVDIVHGNANPDETRSCLERIFNPIVEESILPIHQTTSLSPGWVGGRTVGNLYRRPSFLTSFRLSRPLRTMQRPGYISFYQKLENTSEMIVTGEEANRWLKQSHQSNSNHNHPSIKTKQKFHIESNLTEIQLSSLKRNISPSRPRSCSTTHEHTIIHILPRRAGWASLVNH